MEQPLDLPYDIAALRELVIKLQGEVQHLNAQKAHLHEQIRLLLHKRFGAHSEKYIAEQADIFNEAEANAENDSIGENDLPENDKPPFVIENSNLTKITANKPGRKTLPAELPRIEIIHDLADDQKRCPEGHALKEIGTEISEQLDIIPAKVQVLRHIRKKYACPCCGNGVKIAPMPPQPIPKSNASPALLAFVVTGKFLDGLPLYLQTKQFDRIGVNLPRATLANWMIRCGELIQPLINLMQEQINGYPIQQIDETRVQVLKEPGKAASTQSYMWIQRGGPPEQRIILFTYAPSRSQTIAEQLLQGYQGYLQTDGYAAYANVCTKYGLRQLGCWAHVRRKFDEALKAQGENPLKANSIASYALATIQKLYRIESEIKHLSSEQKRVIRQESALPVLNEMRIWLDHVLTQITPSSLTGTALSYLAKQWSTLTVYCEDGRLEIDNNSVERAIRPFVIGRNNWLFTDTVNGAKASANLYSLIETAKLNGLEPYQYLCHVFAALPKAQTIDDIDQLLRWQIPDDAIITIPMNMQVA
ncbi:IS66 family transposase [Methyloglobulus sp.]|uniref:IS66 family transposase n=1 Tax=Methyloglobulus sp. TaxID=2518622 RepID=UPI0032B805AF